MKKTKLIIASAVTSACCLAVVSYGHQIMLMHQM